MSCFLCQRCFKVAETSIAVEYLRMSLTPLFPVCQSIHKEHKQEPSVLFLFDVVIFPLRSFLSRSPCLYSLALFSFMFSSLFLQLKPNYVLSKGDEDLLIPVHGYPVINDLHIPSRLDLPAAQLGQRCVCVCVC